MHVLQEESQGMHMPIEASKNSPDEHEESGVSALAPRQILEELPRIDPSIAALR